MPEQKNLEEVDENASQENEVQYLKTDLWLSLSKSEEAVAFDKGNEKLYAGKSLFVDLLDTENDEVKTVSFSQGTDEGFEQSEYFIGLSKSGKALVLPYHGKRFVMPAQQFERLLEGEIEGAPFHLPIEK